MKTKLIMMTLCVFMMLCISACSGDTKTSYENYDSSAAISESEDIGETTMIMKIGDTKVNVDWEDNQAVEALRNMAEDGDVTIQMSMYGNYREDTKCVDRLIN